MAVSCRLIANRTGLTIQKPQAGNLRLSCVRFSGRENHASSLILAWYASRLGSSSCGRCAAVVKCEECGFLCVRDFNSRRLIEADTLYREKGRSPNPFMLAPICFVQAERLWEESTAVEHAQVMEIIRKERTCDKFTPWFQGYAPKEHIEMQLLQEQMNEQRKQNRRNLWITVFAMLAAAIIGAAATLAGTWLILTHSG